MVSHYVFQRERENDNDLAFKDAIVTLFKPSGLYSGSVLNANLTKEELLLNQLLQNL